MKKFVFFLSLILLLSLTECSLATEEISPVRYDTSLECFVFNPPQKENFNDSHGRHHSLQRERAGPCPFRFIARTFGVRARGGGGVRRHGRSALQSRQHQRLCAALA